MESAVMAAVGKNRGKVARGWRAWYPFTTGEFIRSYLLEHGEAYIYEVQGRLQKNPSGDGSQVVGKLHLIQEIL